jgi:hypothetical protein
MMSVHPMLLDLRASENSTTPKLIEVPYVTQSSFYLWVYHAWEEDNALQAVPHSSMLTVLVTILDGFSLLSTLTSCKASNRLLERNLSYDSVIALHI